MSVFVSLSTSLQLQLVGIGFRILFILLLLLLLLRVHVVSAYATRSMIPYGRHDLALAAGRPNHLPTAPSQPPELARLLLLPRQPVLFW